MSEAIDNRDKALLEEELGDVLLQVVFHAQMEAEEGAFDLMTSVTVICKKLILRHPLIFGDVVASTSEVLRNWDGSRNRKRGRNPD